LPRRLLFVPALLLGRRAFWHTPGLGLFSAAKPWPFPGRRLFRTRMFVLFVAVVAAYCLLLVLAQSFIVIVFI
jgi:hypothetical protein